MRPQKPLVIAMAIVMLSMILGGSQEASAGLKKKLKNKALRVVKEAGNSVKFTGWVAYENLKPKNWRRWTPLILAATPTYPILYFFMPRCICSRKKAQQLPAEQEKLLKETERQESHLKTVVFDGIEFVEVPRANS